MARFGIKDIAARAGVSIATVSHAFRNPGRVSDKTREKVLKAAKEVGYTPNVHAVSLRTAKSGSIVVIMPDVADSYNANIIKGIESVARDRGYSVLLGDSGGSEEREREFAAMVQSRQADGIILMSHRMPFDLPDDIAFEDLPPLVNGSEYTGHDEFPCVSIDDRQGAIDATKHLLQLGHTDIAIITGEKDSTSSRNRLDGYQRAMADAGVAVDESLVIIGEYTADSGEYGTRELMVRKRRPTAIFCFSDEIALGCIYALQDAGFAVPQDVSVIGFDDIPFSRYFVPSLTTIAQPTEAIGRTCATLLCDMIDGKRPKKNRFILPHALIVRDSTAKPASAN